MSQVPMSYPDLVMHMSHHDRGCPTIIEMDDGRLLLAGYEKIFVSRDGGLTWPEHFTGIDSDGRPVVANSMSMVKLDGECIGMHGLDIDHGFDEPRHLYWRSEDRGKNWSVPVVMTPPDRTARAYLDTMIRTRSGRLVAPFYTAVRLGDWYEPGQPERRKEDNPVGGGLVNGVFVSTSCHNFDPALGTCYVCYSDDEGRTWSPQDNGQLFINWEVGSLYGSVFEPSIVEVSPGKLLMFMRTGLGRLFESWSYDDGVTWNRPAPTNLASSHSPAQLERLPNGHLLCIWNQQSEDEVRRGFIRTRISTAISRNEGVIWEHFQNLESIHEEVRVEPGPIRPTRTAQNYCLSGRIPPERDGRFVTELPTNLSSCSYPTALVCKDRVLIHHSNGYVAKQGERLQGDRGYKILPLRWFYGDREPFENPNLPKDPNVPAVP